MPNSAILTAETEKIVTETASVQSPSTSLEDKPSPGPSEGGNSIYSFNLMSLYSMHGSGKFF